jgi:hypothetical protein
MVFLNHFLGLVDAFGYFNPAGTGLGTLEMILAWPDSGR